jgi:CBS domain-containing protein
MTVRDIARDRRLITARPATPAQEVAEMMHENGVGSVVVTTTENPVGIVTDRDVAMAVATEADLSALTAADLMTEDPVTIDPEAGILELTTLMDDHGVRRVPVVEESQLVGIVTLDDLVQLLTVELANLAGVVHDESPPY